MAGESFSPLLAPCRWPWRESVNGFWGGTWGHPPGKACWTGWSCPLSPPNGGGVRWAKGMRCRRWVRWWERRRRRKKKERGEVRPSEIVRHQNTTFTNYSKHPMLHIEMETNHTQNHHVEHLACRARSASCSTKQNFFKSTENHKWLGSNTPQIGWLQHHTPTHTHPTHTPTQGGDRDVLRVLVMVLTRLPLPGGPTEGERCGGRRGRERQRRRWRSDRRFGATQKKFNTVGGARDLGQGGSVSVGSTLTSVSLLQFDLRREDEWAQTHYINLVQNWSKLSTV